MHHTFIHNEEESAAGLTQRGLLFKDRNQMVDINKTQSRKSILDTQHEGELSSNVTVIRRNIVCKSNPGCE